MGKLINKDEVARIAGSEDYQNFAKNCARNRKNFPKEKKKVNRVLWYDEDEIIQHFKEQPIYTCNKRVEISRHFDTSGSPLDHQMAQAFIRRPYLRG